MQNLQAIPEETSIDLESSEKFDSNMQLRFGIKNNLEN